MLPLLAHPLALLGLAALPALAAIYLFRQRHRRHVVSSLLLWRDVGNPLGGGERLRRLETPLLFFLELLTLLLLVAAAVNPLFFVRERSRPLIVILDDSYAMQAGGRDSSRVRAIAAILEELRRQPRTSVRFILAGERPQALGETVATPAEAAILLDGWRCPARTARLDEALALALQVGGDEPLLLVVTDKAPDAEPEEGRVQWWAFGEPRPNLAFVTASRFWRGDKEQINLTVANLSPEPGKTTLIVEMETPPVEIARRDLSLQSRSETRVELALPEDAPPIRARLDDDALAVDNQVVLLPGPRRTVRVVLQIGAEALRKPVEKGIRSVRDVALAGDRPELVITDRDEVADLPADAWLVHLRADKDAEAWTGPFVLDRAHPLTRGLPLTGVIWGGGKSKELPGSPVILAGSVPLLTETLKGERRELWLRWRPDLSTLQDTPAWPALLYNLVQWRTAARHQLDPVNVRLGEEVGRTFAADPATVTMTDPVGQRHPLTPRDRRLVVRAEQVGTYRLESPEGRESFAVNALSKNASDLTECVTGRWGDWRDENTLAREYRSMAGPMLLAALAVLAVHLLVARKRSSS